MKIQIDRAVGTVTLVPVRKSEKETVRKLKKVLQKGERICYHSRFHDKNKYCVLTFGVGGTRVLVNKTSGNFTHIKCVHKGGFEFVLRGSTIEDKKLNGSIRDVCFFGSTGLIYDRKIKVDGKDSLVFTACLCRDCGKNMISLSECEGKICDNCSEKCEHDYIRGLVHGGSVDIGVGYYCSKCNRGKPFTESEKKKTQAEHHASVVNETGISIAYKNAPNILLVKENATGKVVLTTLSGSSILGNAS